MNYEEVIRFLYHQFPLFEKKGGDAYHPGLERIAFLCEKFGNPHQKFKSIHIAGTNGKGSCSHLLAAVLQASGYKVGLYTSPHLKEFTERIKVNGTEISKQVIVDFIQTNYAFFKDYSASFFEITTLLAFIQFAKEKVDIAVIETGLGGRLDATNCIKPLCCLITNIGFDHMQFLGTTLEEIATEKAGIIKENIPVVIGEIHPTTQPIFLQKAMDLKAPIIFAENNFSVTQQILEEKNQFVDIHSAQGIIYKNLMIGLGGIYQKKNIISVLATLQVLQQQDWQCNEQHLRRGFEQVVTATGLKGRWYFLQDSPRIICDTGHNEDGIKFVVEQLKSLSYDRLYMVFGMVKDKESDKILSLLPKNAYYYFTKPSIERALDENTLYARAINIGLTGEPVENVSLALKKAKEKLTPKDVLFIGGSTFVVAEVI